MLLACMYQRKAFEESSGSSTARLHSRSICIQPSQLEHSDASAVSRESSVCPSSLFPYDHFKNVERDLQMIPTIYTRGKEAKKIWRKEPELAPRIGNKEGPIQTRSEISWIQEIPKSAAEANTKIDGRSKYQNRWQKPIPLPEINTKIFNMYGVFTWSPTI